MVIGEDDLEEVPEQANNHHSTKRVDMSPLLSQEDYTLVLCSCHTTLANKVHSATWTKIVLRFLSLPILQQVFPVRVSEIRRGHRVKRT